MEKKGKSLLVMGFGAVILVVLSLAFVLALQNDSGNTKQFTQVGDYGKISILDKSNVKLAEYTLTDNSNQCLINCYAEGTAVLYKTGKLFSDMKFYDSLSRNKNVNYNIYIEQSYEVDVDDYKLVCEDVYNSINKTNEKSCTSVKDGSHTETRKEWVEYKGQDLVPGTYNWRLEGTKKANENVDWVGISNGLELSEWAWWNSSWEKKREINITENSGRDLYNYTINISISYNESYKDGFDDLRFLNGSEDGELYYWLDTENGTMNGTSTIAWVMIPYLPDSQTISIYMYYNNPDADTTGNIKTAFLVGDDFNDGSIDAKWTYSGASESGGVLTVIGDGSVAYIYTTTGVTSNTSFTTFGKRINLGLGDFNGVGGDPTSWGGSTILSNATVMSGDSTNLRDLTYFVPTFDYSYNNDGAQVDYAFMRNWVSNEPSSIIGNEQNVAPPDEVAPEVSSIEITPSTPTSLNDLNCYATLTDDKQQNLTAYFIWYKNNEIYSDGVLENAANNTNTLISTLSSGNFIKNDEIFCNIIPFDGYNNGTSVNSSSVTILNSIPSQSEPLLKTLSGKNLSTENLTCINQSTFDADGDEITNIFNWYKDNSPLMALLLPFEINENDYSGNQNNGVLTGGERVNGIVGKALSFDGINNLEIADSNSLDFTNEKTWEIWFKRDSTGAETIFNKGNETESNYKLEFLSNDILKFSYSIASGWQEKSEDFDLSSGDYNQTYYNATENAVMLDNSLDGDYLSDVFSDSGKELMFDTLIWSEEVPESAELTAEENMSGLWHFNENSGSIAYDSASNNNGEVIGASWTSGKFNSALSFDGINNGVFVLDSDDLSFGDGVNDNAFTISAWIYPLDIIGADSILIKDGASGNKEYQFYLSNGVLTAYLYNLGGTSYIGKYYATALNSSEWYQVSMVYNGNKSSSGISLYVDGQKVSDAVSQSGTYIAMNNTKSNLTIGMHPTSSWYFNGTIDEVAVWNKELSSEEILDNYNKGSGIIANISFSARSCENSDCSDKGNNFDITGLTSPADISSLSNNKYFQFKADFATDNEDYSPKLFSVGLNYSSQVEGNEANITSVSAVSDTADWHLATVTYSNNDLKLYLDGELENENTESLPNSFDNNLIIGDGFLGDLDEFRIYNNALKGGQINSNFNLEYNKIISEETEGGDNYFCEVTPNDAESDGNVLNSTSLEVLWSVLFNVTDSYSGAGLNYVTINCNYSGFNQEGDTANPYGAYGFPEGNWECNFAENLLGHFNTSITFLADGDKELSVLMSKEGYLTPEEHTWLEAIYNCIISGNCNLYNLLLEINQTTSNIWEQTKPTDESVVVFENITNNVVDSSHNLTIDYTIDIPIKARYSLGDYLPVRMGFWFLNENNETCYNQGEKPVGVEDPYCQPLIIETLGPMGNSISFTTKLHPELPVGTYNIKRVIDIDPNNVWINYGQESIGTFYVTETLADSSASLEKSGEVMLNSNENNNQQSSSSSSSDKSSSSSKTIYVYNTQTSNDGEQKYPNDGGIIELNSPITGNAIGNNPFSGIHAVLIFAIIAGVLIAFIISNTLLRLKRR